MFWSHLGEYLPVVIARYLAAHPDGPWSGEDMYTRRGDLLAPNRPWWRRFGLAERPADVP
jgi:hypothetical protein